MMIVKMLTLAIGMMKEMKQEPILTAMIPTNLKMAEMTIQEVQEVLEVRLQTVNSSN
ncbi:hypothetical protein D3C87_2139190 [compost metagenome]